MDPGAAWETLLSSEYDNVKIINNSWGTAEEDIGEDELNTIFQLTGRMVEKTS